MLYKSTAMKAGSISIPFFLFFKKDLWLLLQKSTQEFPRLTSYNNLSKQRSSQISSKKLALFGSIFHDRSHGSRSPAFDFIVITLAHFLGFEFLVRKEENILLSHEKQGKFEESLNSLYLPNFKFYCILIWQFFTFSEFKKLSSK